MSITRPIRVITHIVVVLTACAGSKETNSVSSRDTNDTPNGMIRSDTSASAVASAPRLGAGVDSDSVHHTVADSTIWTVTASGFGPVRVGMTAEQARAVLGGDLTVTGGAPSCGYASSRHLPPGVNFMITDGKIARVQVLRGTVATAAGARVGDSEQRIRGLYPARLATSPHKYTSGHYLTVTPASAVDSAMRIVFETDGSRVTVYRSGMLPEVEWVEGCS